MDLREKEMAGGWRKCHEDPHNCSEKYYEEDRIREDRMGKACSKHEKFQKKT